ncbi:MAG: UPF0236 family protein [Ardenticatenaceae bacterium]|nr:UPF0236 family protein [Ardenticatenaceae bacterium]
MDFNTQQVQEAVEQIATILSNLVVAGVQGKDGVGMGKLEAGMRQMLQEVGRQALTQVMEKSDIIEPSIRCICQHQAAYRCRREGMVITVFGRVKYKRSYYICPQCGRGEKPLDKRLQIMPGEMSPGLKPLLALLGIQTSFDEAAKLAKLLLLVDIIWRLIEENFPQAIQILDWYHAVEYLTPVAQAAFQETDKQTAWLTTMKEHLWFSRTQTVIDACLAVADPTSVSDPAAKAATYFQNNLARMDYASLRQQGYFMGSGALESGCKQIGTMRLKRSGAQWLEDGARWVAKARAVWLSGQWQEVVHDYASLPVTI